ncbi:MAG: metal-dependent phosphohydrolase, partial [Massilia sp.]
MSDSVPAADSATAVSVLRELNRVNERLEHLLTELGAYTEADLGLRVVAAELVDAVDRDPDIAFAAILLNQIAGR